MSIPCLAIILQAIASAIATAGSESILAASIILLAAAAIVFTTFAVFWLAATWFIKQSIRCLINTLPAMLFFVGSAICGLLKSSWHIVNSKAAVVALPFTLALPPSYATEKAALFITLCVASKFSIWCINKSIVCGLGILFFFGSCFSWCIEKCIVAAVCGIIGVARVLRATLIFVGSCGIGSLFFFGSCISWCISKSIVAAVCGIIGVAKVLRATLIFVGSCVVGVFKSSSQAIAVAMSNIRLGFAYILPAVIEQVGSCWTGDSPLHHGYLDTMLLHSCHVKIEDSQIDFLMAPKIFVPPKKVRFHSKVTTDVIIIPDKSTMPRSSWRHDAKRADEELDFIDSVVNSCRKKARYLPQHLRERMSGSICEIRLSIANAKEAGAFHQECKEAYEDLQYAICLFQCTYRAMKALEKEDVEVDSDGDVVMMDVEDVEDQQANVVSENVPKKRKLENRTASTGNPPKKAQLVVKVDEDDNKTAQIADKVIIKDSSRRAFATSTAVSMAQWRRSRKSIDVLPTIEEEQVRWADTLVSSVRTRPRTLSKDVSALFYSEADERRSRLEAKEEVELEGDVDFDNQEVADAEFEHEAAEPTQQLVVPPTEHPETVEGAIDDVIAEEPAIAQEPKKKGKKKLARELESTLDGKKWAVSGGKRSRKQRDVFRPC
jgi:hypothetical protein